MSFHHVNHSVSVSQKNFNVARIAELLQVHEGAVESQNCVTKRLTKRECFKTLTEDGQRWG